MSKHTSARGRIRRLRSEVLRPWMVSRLASAPKKPVHVAIIMDGNGRWATNRGLPRVEGHRAGTRAVRRVVEACIQFGIPHLSLFAFSTENWSRPAEEVNALMDLFVEQLDENLEELDRQGVRIHLVGRREGVPGRTVAAFDRAETRTAQNEKLHLYLLVNYSGRAEIVDAINRVIADGARCVDEESFARYLYVPDAPEPDLIIRTSGEERLSNFYLWQGAYAELYFTPTLWPDFDMYDLYRALVDFARRRRRFGGLTEF